MKQILVLASLAVLLVTGCSSVSDHVSGASAGVTYDHATGAIGGTVSVTFKDFAGIEKSCRVARAGVRGFDTSGNFVSLERLKQIAITRFNDPNAVETQLAVLGNRDLETILYIVNSLIQNGAVRGSVK